MSNQNVELARAYFDGIARTSTEGLPPEAAIYFEYELVDAGERVVALLDLRMRGRSSGIEVALGKHAWVITFKDELMVHHKLYMNQADALAAVGLSGARRPR